MKKDSLYKIIIGLLLALNLLQVAFYSKGPRHPMPPHNRGQNNRKIVEDFDLSDKQLISFNKLARNHHEQMISLNEDLKEKTLVYFQSPSDSLVNEINKISFEKIDLTEQHFEDIERLLNDEQKEQFNEFKTRSLKHILR